MAIGVNEAIVLQQLFWLLRDPNNGKKIAEKQWIFNTYEQWQVQYFPFWCERTLKTIFTNLQRLNLIEVCQPEGRLSRRKYYRINDSALDLIPERAKNVPSNGQELPDGNGQNSSVPITKTTSKTSVQRLQRNEGKQERRHKSAECAGFKIPEADQVNEFASSNKLDMPIVVAWWKINHHFGWAPKGRRIRNWKKALLSYVKLWQKPKQDTLKNDEFWRKVREAHLDEHIVNEWVDRMKKRNFHKENPVTGAMEPIRDYFASAKAFCDMVEDQHISF